MKKFAKTLVLATALVVSLSVGAGNTAEAAKKKPTVSKVTAVNKLTSKKSITLTKGKTATLKVTIKGKNLTKAAKKVSYKSSKPSVATVKKGKITAKAKGSAKITVTSTYNKKKKATVNVKVVTAKVTKVAITPATLTLKEGAQESLKANVTAGKGANKTVVWTSSDTKVAKVSSKGVVTAVAEGTAKITAKATDGSGKKGTATVTVVKAEQNTTSTEQKTTSTEQNTTAQVNPTPLTVEKQTVIAPKDAEAVEVTVTFANAGKVQEDVDALAKVAVKSGDDIEVELDGVKYVASYDGKNVKIAGKLIADSETAKAAKSVRVKADVKADKIAALTAFAPTSVESVQYGNVTFTEIKADSFKIGQKSYQYTVSGKNVVVKGDVAADFEALKSVATVTTEDVK